MPHDCSFSDCEIGWVNPQDVRFGEHLGTCLCCIQERNIVFNYDVQSWNYCHKCNLEGHRCQHSNVKVMKS